MKIASKKWLIVLLTFSLSLSFWACDEDENTSTANDDPTTELTLVADTTVQDLALQLFCATTLHTGDNELYFKITPANASSVAGLTLFPMMNMATMNHTCPTGAVQELTDFPGLFSTHVMFIMPSGMMGSWDMTLTITFDDGSTMELVLAELTVLDSPWLESFVHTANGDTTSYFVSLDGLQESIVGLNDVTLWVAEKESMLSFPPVNGLSTTIETLMPSMGHGSSGNVAPVFQEAGLYTGVVGFNMSGDWEVSITLTDPLLGQLGEVVFAFDF